METGTMYRRGEAVGCNEYESFGGTPVTYGPDQYACPDLVPVHLEDGPGAYPCGAPAWTREDGGHACAAGHEYTPMAVRHALGIEYADDPIEAQRLREAGIAPIERY